ncbi:MAG TPA: chemotaxis protein CheB [Gemmatimonadales bacterium]
MNAERSPNRDVIVVGASMGGIEALSNLANKLPADLPAAVLVVQHIAETSPALLSAILDRKGPLPAVTAEDRMPLERGRIYVAPPGRHMLVGKGGTIRVVFGPRENRARPAIDPLFRTAAVHCRSQVIGVILTGLLSDGAAGLYAVARCGGVAIVQAPDDAPSPEMPRRALERVPEAVTPTLAELAPLLGRLAREPAPPPPEIPETLETEVRLTERAMRNDDWFKVPGRPTNFTCPECMGAIQELDESGQRRYRCRVGHAYSAEDLLGEKGSAVEDTLWVALQTLEERAEMLASMARDDRVRGRSHSAAGYEERARETATHAERLRELLRSLPV